jgi:hypothetical protein
VVRKIIHQQQDPGGDEQAAQADAGVVHLILVKPRAAPDLKSGTSVIAGFSILFRTYQIKNPVIFGPTLQMSDSARFILFWLRD